MTRVLLLLVPMMGPIVLPKGTLEPNPATDLTRTINAARVADLAQAQRVASKGVLADPTNAVLREVRDLLRARTIYPNDPEAARQLRPEVELYPSWLFSTTWYVLGWLTWCGLCIIVIQRQRQSRRMYTLTAVLLPLAAVPLANELVQMQRDHRQRVAPLVVTRAATPLHAGNGTAYPVKMMIPSACEARIIGQRAGWLHVTFASGLTGWLHDRESTVEYPRAP